MSDSPNALLPTCDLGLRGNGIPLPMSKQTLTDVAIRKLAPPESGQLEVWDARVPGFGVRISPKGTRSFVLLYRMSGKPRRLTLGRYPVLSLSDARTQAQVALAEIAAGRDPGSLRRAAKVGDSTEGYSLVFDLFIDEFITKYAAPKNRDWRETQRLFNREFIPIWRGRDIREITKRDVATVIDAMVARGSPGAANHALAAVRRLFNWAVERGLLEHSPVQGLRPPTRLVSRDRVLTDAELIAVWKAAADEGYPFGAIVQLLVLTGQRRGEVAGMRWRDIDAETRTWTLPGELNKSGRAHVLPLTDQAVALIQALPRLSDELVFPSRSSKSNSPVSGIGKAKARINTASGVEDWRLHDIRRTVATGMARLKVPPHVVEKVLNHSSGTFSGVYNRFGYLDEMREALEAWGAHLRKIVGTAA